MPRFLALFAGGLFLALLALVGGCSSPIVIDPAQKPQSSAIAAPRSPLGRRVARVVASQPADESGFLTLEKGEESLLWRGVLVDRAQRSVDAQYFIWSQDNVGTIAAERLLTAAERGVRVRVLVDEVTLDADPRFLAFLNDHPKVEIRVYNPTGSIGRGGFARALRFLGDFSRANRRMHNKALVADGSIAIVGGRNIADEYFDLDTHHNFRDRDVMAIGAVVPRIASAFDEYWNSDWVAPLASVVDVAVDPTERDAYYAELHAYAADPLNFPPRFDEGLADTGRQLDEMTGKALHWGRARLIYDVPGKSTAAEGPDAFSRTGRELTDLALGAQKDLLAQTPYLIMLPGTWDLLEALRARGVRVRIHTNTLAVTDAIAVHSSYAFQRRRLLDLGVELYEYRADAANRPDLIDRYALMEKDAILALHAKTMVIDGKTVFIGSFNMDPRSTHINTEMGVVIESPSLAAEVARRIEDDIAPENSWRLSLTEDRRLQWSGERDGESLVRHSEPDAGFGKMLWFMLLAPLPITPLL